MYVVYVCCNEGDKLKECRISQEKILQKNLETTTTLLENC